MTCKCEHVTTLCMPGIIFGFGCLRIDDDERSARNIRFGRRAAVAGRRRRSRSDNEWTSAYTKALLSSPNERTDTQYRYGNINTTRRTQKKGRINTRSDMTVSWRSDSSDSNNIDWWFVYPLYKHLWNELVVVLLSRLSFRSVLLSYIFRIVWSRFWISRSNEFFIQLIRSWKKE